MSLAQCKYTNLPNKNVVNFVSKSHQFEAENIFTLGDFEDYLNSILKELLNIKINRYSV
jgi:hypothetical protein